MTNQSWSRERLINYWPLPAIIAILAIGWFVYRPALSGTFLLDDIPNLSGLASIDDFPFQTGTSLNAAGINYNTLRAADVMNRIEKMEGFARPGN